MSQPALPDDYEIVRLLGEGGMGRVYLAQQLRPIRRQVALKLIRSTGTDSRQRQRFEAERQAMARMNHPNIAQIYDAGELTDGQPYVVMEYVPGMPIVDYCDRERLSVEQRLALFVGVCQGIQHAHQKGLLHRDIKPSNVLVTEVAGLPTAKVIDFGIAKAIEGVLTDSYQPTADGAIIGTPSYLSPEAFGSEEGLDTRSDVYSLGVLFYELIAAGLPFETKSIGLLALVTELSESEPSSPSRSFRRLSQAERARAAGRRRVAQRALERRLAGDLAWIGLKAVAKDRNERYASAAELAADIERHLADEVVVAGPPSRAYRARKFVRRNRIAVLAAIAVAVSLVAGIVSSTRSSLRAQREAVRANQEARTARTVSDFLVSLFQVAEPGGATANALTAREVLDEGARRIRLDLAKEPTTQATMMATIGRVYLQLGLYEQAEPLLSEALELRREHEPGSAVLARSLNDLGLLAKARGETAPARTYYRRALQLSTQASAGSDADVGNVLYNLGALALNEEELEVAGDHYRAALKARTAAFGPDHYLTAEVIQDLGVVDFQLGRYSRAERSFEEAIDIWQRTLGPDHFWLAYGYLNLGLNARAQGQLEAASDAFGKSGGILASAVAPDHPLVGVLGCWQGQALLGLQRHEEARQVFEKSAEILEARLGPADARTVDTLFGLAQAFERLEQYAAAETHFRSARAAARLRQNREGDSPSVVHQLASLELALGRLARRREDEPRAETHFETALELVEPLMTDDASSRLRVVWVESLHRLGRTEESRVEAESLLRAGDRDKTLLAICRELGIEVEE